MPSESKKETGFSRCYGDSCTPRGPNPCDRWSTHFFRYIIDVGQAEFPAVGPGRRAIPPGPYEYPAQSKFRLHEFVVMPNHFHLLLTIESGMTIERAVRFVKGGFSFRAGKELGMRTPVWQKGFSEVRISDAQAFLQVRMYIHNNPVERHLVANPADYLHSSAHPGFELDPLPEGMRTACSAYGVEVA